MGLIQVSKTEEIKHSKRTKYFLRSTPPEILFYRLDYFCSFTKCSTKGIRPIHKTSSWSLLPRFKVTIL